MPTHNFSSRLSHPPPPPRAFAAVHVGVLLRHRLFCCFPSMCHFMQRACFRRRRLISPQKPAAPLIAHNQGFEISCSRKRRGGGGRQRGEWKRSKSPACGVSFDPPAELNGRKWKPLCGSKESSFQPPACLSPATGAARLPCLQCPSSLGRSWLKVRDGAGLLWEAGTVAVPLPLDRDPAGLR